MLYLRTVLILLSVFLMGFRFFIYDIEYLKWSFLFTKITTVILFISWFLLSMKINKLKLVPNERFLKEKTAKFLKNTFSLMANICVVVGILSMIFKFNYYYEIIVTGLFFLFLWSLVIAISHKTKKESELEIIDDME